jgi:hypothetical protein
VRQEQGLRATAPPLGQRRADHRLDLMEEHEREDGRAHGVRSEDHLSHGDALRQAFLRAAEDDGHPVCTLEAQPLADEPSGDQRGGSKGRRRRRAGRPASKGEPAANRRLASLTVE